MSARTCAGLISAASLLDASVPDARRGVVGVLVWLVPEFAERAGELANAGSLELRGCWFTFEKNVLDIYAP